MESNNDAPTFDGVFDLSKELEAPGARRPGTAGQNQFDRLGTGTSAKCDKADAGNFMRAQTWIFSMQINDFLPDRGRKCAFILSGDRRWWLWRQQTGHADRIEEIGPVVHGSLRHARFSRTFFRCLSPQDDGANDFVLDLRGVFEQCAQLLPIVCWLSTFIPTVG